MSKDNEFTHAHTHTHAPHVLESKDTINCRNTRTKLEYIGIVKSRMQIVFNKLEKRRHLKRRL